VTDRVKFLQQDLFKSDISEATVVTLYLLPELNVKLRPQLFRQLKPGTRVVSHDFDMGDWKPDRVVQTQEGSTIYWVIRRKFQLTYAIEARLIKSESGKSRPFTSQGC